MSEKFRTNSIPLAGTIDGSVIFGVSVATTGEAQGHHLMFDDKSLDQLQQLGSSKANGIKSRFTHPDWFHDGLGKYLGRVKNFHVASDKLYGDLYISPSAHSSPAGNLAEYVLALASEDPTAFGVSVVVDLDRVWPTNDGQELPATGGKPANAIGKFPVARITSFYAADLVDEPALNPEGLFQTVGVEQVYRSTHNPDGLSNSLPVDYEFIQEGPVISQQGAEAPCRGYEQEAKAPCRFYEQEAKDTCRLYKQETKAPCRGYEQETKALCRFYEQEAKDPYSENWREAIASRKSNKGENQAMEEQEFRKYLSDLNTKFDRVSKLFEDGIVQIGGQPPRGQQVSMGPAALEQFQGYFDWLFGAPGARLPPPDLRRADALYRAVTGDVEFHGKFDPSHVAFAAATTTTLADLAVNAMNKVVLDLYSNLTAYRWYELITAVQATDGSLQDMQWLQLGGLTNLPVVAEGAAYTELTVSDTKETSAFYKYGGYVGITDKMIRNSKIDELQAIARALTIAAIRTRSAYIAALFTTASGTGPTLAQDSTVLFHANHGSNVQTTAFSIAAWAAARLECAKMAELGSSKRQVLWPKYALVPVDLYDTALIAFGYGSGPGGYPGTPNNDTHIYAVDRPGDTRPVPVCVPDWTDTNDWAYIVDPRIAPVICMAYADNPGGTSHPAPQLYSVTDPTSGLLFTNDTLPIKVRDYFAYGVATWRGIGKRNVT